MRRYTPLVLLTVIPLILVSCGKSDDVIPTQTGVTSSGKEASPYTLEQYKEMFANRENIILPISSGDISTQDVSSYLQSNSRNIRDLIEVLS